MNQTQKIAKAVKKQIEQAVRVQRMPATIVGAVSGRKSYTTVTMPDGSTLEVLNQRVANVANLQVWLGVDPLLPEVLQVLGVQNSFEEGTGYGIADHHTNHEYPSHDTVWVQGAQFLPLDVLPAGGFSVQVYGDVLEVAGTLIKVANQTVDLSASQPATGALWTILQVDNAGTVTAVDGATAAGKTALTLADIPAATAGNYRFVAIMLYADQTAIQRNPNGIDDFVDLRRAGLAVSGYAGYDLAATIHAASASAVTASDEFGFWEDTSGLLKKITWANVQATLETYFDTQYQPLDATLTSLSALADASGFLSNDGAGNLSWAAASGTPFVDTTAIVKGSVDATKLLRFEVDGFTTATTRVITPPNADITLAGQNYANVFTAAQMIDGASDVVQSRTQAHSTQTANLFTLESSTSALHGHMTGDGIMYFSRATTTPAGTYNLFLGGAGNATASNALGTNIGLGSGVLAALTGGYGNFGGGENSLNKVSSGIYNFGFGAYALYSITTTSYNIGIGPSSFQSHTGSYATGIGTNTFQTKTTGNGDVAIGSFAGQLAGNGSEYDTYIGYSSGRVGTGVRNYDTCLGAYSGYSLDTGSGRILIGSYAGYNQTTASNLLIIDNAQRASTAVEATNAILYGVMASTPASQTLSINAVTTIGSTVAGALVIGVGTATIDYNITFNGETNDGVLTWMEDEDYFKFSDDVMMADGENIVLDTTTGSKIGTATTQKLAFWNATPIVQPSGATQAAPAAYVTGGFGLDSDANMQALYDLVVAMRTALVNTGIMKGAA